MLSRRGEVGGEGVSIGAFGGCSARVSKFSAREGECSFSGGGISIGRAIGVNASCMLSSLSAKTQYKPSTTIPRIYKAYLAEIGRRDSRFRRLNPAPVRTRAENVSSEGLHRWPLRTLSSRVYGPS